MSKPSSESRGAQAHREDLQTPGPAHHQPEEEGGQGQTLLQILQGTLKRRGPWKLWPVLLHHSCDSGDRDGRLYRRFHFWHMCWGVPQQRAEKGARTNGRHSSGISAVGAWRLCWGHNVGGIGEHGTTHDSSTASDGAVAGIWGCGTPQWRLTHTSHRVAS